MQTSLEEGFQITLIHGISGSAAAVLSTSLLYPFENIKTRMQVLDQSPKKKRVLRNKKRKNTSIDYTSLDNFPKEVPSKPLAVTSLDRYQQLKSKELEKPALSPSKEPRSKVKPINPLLHLKNIQTNRNIRCDKRSNSAILMRRFSKQQSFEEKPLSESPEKRENEPSPQKNSAQLPRKPHTFQEKSPRSGLSSRKPQKNSQEDASMWEFCVEICRKEGLLGLYKGITPLLIGNFISYGVYFFWYEAFKRFFNIKTNDILGHSKIALFSGVIATTCTNPFWIINAKMTLQRGHASFLQTIMKILENEGLAGFFKGIWTSYSLVVNPIVQFSIYEFIKNKLKRSQNKTLVYFFGGAISKALATVLTYPYQVIRTNIHIEKSNRTFFQIAKEIRRTGGWLGFFKGLSPKLSQTVLNSAFLLLIYEKVFYFFWVLLFKQPQIKKMLDNFNEQ